MNDWPQDDLRDELEALYEAAPLGIAMLDRDLRFVRINSALAEINGYSAQAHIGRRVWEMVPDLQESAEAALRRVLETGEALRDVPVVGETPSQPGVVREWRETFYPVRDRDGEIVGVGIFCEELTDKERLRRRLEEMERRASRVLATVADGFIALGHDWRIMLVNAKGEEILRPLVGDAAGIVGRDFWEVFPEASASPFGDAFRKAAAEQNAVAIEEYYPPFKTWFNARCYPIEDGLAIHFLDIGERKRAEIALRDSESQFRELAESMPQLVWTARPDGEVDYYNSRVADYFGANLGLDGVWRWEGLVHPEDSERTIETWKNAAASLNAYQCTHRIKMRDGSFRWHLSRAQPVFDENGRLRRWFGTATDIQELETASRHRQVLIDELNHRVKNTLALVQSLAHQTLREGAGPAAVQDFQDRLAALASAHNVLTRRHWERASLREIILSAAGACGIDASRLELEGRDVTLQPKQALTAAIVIHELATNAHKYGALSVPEGRVRVAWVVQRGRFRLDWRETGGPPVEPPARIGFGTRMIERAARADFGAIAAFRYDREGFSCAIETSPAEPTP